MDEGATHTDESAAPLPLLHLSTDAVPPRERADLMGDVIAAQLAGATITGMAGTPWCDWRMEAFAPGLVLCNAVQGGFTARRDAAMLRDGDADLSIFIGRKGAVPCDQGDRRSVIRPGDAVICAHGRPVETAYADEAMTVLRVPRAMLAGAAMIERAGGVHLDRDMPAVRLLRGYIAGLGRLGGAPRPPIAARHLIELADLVLATAAQIDAGDRAPSGGVQAARLAAMREVIVRRYADPLLDMGRVAASVGLSERAGYRLFEAHGLGFAETLYAVRLDRAAERLRGGWPGRLTDLAFDVGFSDTSHFNRRFRQRFGMTPSDMRQRADSDRRG